MITEEQLTEQMEQDSELLRKLSLLIAMPDGGEADDDAFIEATAVLIELLPTGQLVSTIAITAAILVPQMHRTAVLRGRQERTIASRRVTIAAAATIELNRRLARSTP